ncbi:MAG: M1 family aminopeptidase [Reichenbachiella sp.]|uniref:ABC transporter permease/M1 family aminopeptidase n=1 Tax=Reichenbachiella sp. TaxID=2184521 RepID=UPI0032667F30
MLSVIYFYELKYWLKQPTTYIYAFIFLALATGLMTGFAGSFDEISTANGPLKWANSPINIHKIFGLFKELILFLLPVIIGHSVYRDFKSEMHSVLYTYPFSKASYLFAKWLSSTTIVILLTSMIGLGCMIGSILPSVNPGLIGPTLLSVYLHEYLVYLIPNVLGFGAIIFAVVILTRSVYSGFVAVFVLVALEQISTRIFVSLNLLDLLALFDPFGQMAVQYYTHLWTVVEQNTSSLPLRSLIIYNRIFWLMLSASIFYFGYSRFQFSHSGSIFSWRKSPRSKSRKSTFGSISKIALPRANYQFSFIDHLKSCWKLSQIDFLYIIKNGTFMTVLVVGFLLVLFTLAQMNPQYATKLLPVSWLMLLFPTFFFLMVVHLLTFLYAGILIQRARNSKMNQLVDVTATPNWVLLISKVLAIIKMQIVLLSLIMIAGVLIQTINGFFEYNLGLYLFHLFVINLTACVIWAFLAIFIQTLVTNMYIGLFLLILAAAGFGELHLLGIETDLLKFNQNPDPGFILSYSDMSGYGAGLVPYLLYKTYWTLCGLLLIFGAWTLWIRGFPGNFLARLSIAYNRFNRNSSLVFALLAAAFISMGYIIHAGQESGETDLSLTRTASNDSFEKYASLTQPRVTDVYLDMHIYPEKRSFKVVGKYTLVNLSNISIDTLIINYRSDVNTTCVDQSTVLMTLDETKNMELFRLATPLQPGDSMIFEFEVKNVSNTLFKKNSPIEQNGTFLTSHMFAPGIGYKSDDLDMPHPTDSLARQNMYRSQDADFINFETIVSTSADQIAIAPGYLQKDWIKDGRRYFHYQSTSPVTNDYVFNSGTYAVAKETWLHGKDSVALEIYHHPSHTYNLDRMMRGLKAGLEYNSKYFAPYQHKQARIVEFARSLGNYGQSYANTLPLSEVSFVADVHTDQVGNIDKLYGGIAHEIAHQWWGHQAIPAGTRGYALITESMSEYVALQVTKHEYGLSMLEAYTEQSLRTYLKQRAKVNGKESPLIYNNGQDEAHVPYQKGSLALYALSEYLGENHFNQILRKYLHQVRFKSAPYTTSIDFLKVLKNEIPDSLQYLVSDLFEEVVLYDNSIEEVKVTALDDGTFEATVDFKVSKYNSGAQGIRTYQTTAAPKVADEVMTLPLADYIEIVAYSSEENGNLKIIHRKKYKISETENKLTLTLSQRPSRVAIDPEHLLLDANLKDNFKSL